VANLLDLQKVWESKHVPVIIGNSDLMKVVIDLVGKVKQSDLPVLIEGESGTGKELIARAIHFGGLRSRKQFVAENCASIPASLMEAELFGYVKGAFTGAASDKAGLFELANGGSLFLDEIGIMSDSMQRSLLRVIQESEIRRVGTNNTIKVNVRIIGATNKTLESLVKEEKFRDDLYYRLNVLKIKMPPLRERRLDVPILAEYFLNEIAGQMDVKKSLGDDAKDMLKKYNFPGNVRELKNMIFRAVTLSNSEILTAANLNLSDDLFDDSMPVVLLSQFVCQEELKYIRHVIKKAGGNKTKAARMLGITKVTLHRKLKQHSQNMEKKSTK